MLRKSPSLVNQVDLAVRKAFETAFPLCYSKFQSLLLVQPAPPKFGDFQCMSLINVYKQYQQELGCKTIHEVGERVQKQLQLNSIFDDVNLAKNGFITVRIAPDKLCEELKLLAKTELQYPDTAKLKVVVDFSSPNIAKEMHVGHLRSTILGDTICRILEYIGHSVDRINHLGDWGTQFGMLIQHMLETYPQFEKKLPDLSDLTFFYKEAKKRFDEDNIFQKNAQANVVALQSGDANAMSAWKAICAASQVEFEKVYQRLGTVLESRGESFYNNDIPQVIEQLNQKGLTEISDGALCVFTKISDVPLMLRKSDGGYGYDSTDVTAIWHRFQKVNADWLIYVTDLGQETHFHKVFEIAKMAEWHQPPKTRADHVGFGLVLGEDGKKFKTRSGEVTKLVELLDEAVFRASKELDRRFAESSKNAEESDAANTSSDCQESHFSTEAKQHAANVIAYSAIKYFDLKQNRLSNYKFSFDKMLDPKGNTAVYMLYAYARICAIFRKANVDPDTLDLEDLMIENNEEREVAVYLVKFHYMIESCVRDLQINRLTEYMYNLSVSFSNFYRTCRVLNSEKQTSRLILCKMVQMVLKKSLTLLGSETLEKI